MTASVAYVDGSGGYLGHFDQKNAPAGATAVPVNPTQGFGSVWNGISWTYPPAPPKLDLPTLIAALIAKGVIAQADINTAITNKTGAGIVSALPAGTVVAN